MSECIWYAATSAVLLLLAACGSGSDPEPNSAAAAETVLTVTQMLGAAGGTIELPGNAKLTAAPLSLTSDTSVRISVISTEESLTLFASEAMYSGITEFDSRAIEISLDNSNVSNDITIDINVPSDLLTLQNSGHLIAGMLHVPEFTDDDDKSETHNSFEPMPSSFDASTNVVTVQIPAAIFKYQDQTALVIRLASLPNDATTVRANNFRKSSTASSQACPGDASWESPILFGYRPGITDPKHYYIPNAAMVGPYAEPRLKKDKDTGKTSAYPHGGIDFFAELETPILAVTDGYIESAGNENFFCNAGSTKEKPRKYQNVLNPEYRITLVTPSGERATYRHLLPGSIEVNGVKDPRFSKCFFDDGKGAAHQYPVTAKAKLGLTGASGEAGTPHLHLEWRPAGSGTRNPLCKLAKVSPSTEPSLIGRPFSTYYSDLGIPFDIAPQYWVRRNKGSSPRICTNVREPGVPDGSQCDRPGRGYFLPALAYPDSGIGWPKGSDGFVASLVDFTSRGAPVKVIPRPNFGQFLYSALTHTATPQPTLALFFDEIVVQPADCSVVGSVFNYDISVIYNGLLGNRAKFGPSVTGTFISTLVGSPSHCAPTLVYQ